MMKRTTKGTFTLMNLRFLLPALLAAAAVMVIGGGLVLAQSSKQTIEDIPSKFYDGTIPYVASENPMGWNIPYRYSQDDTYPSYVLARKAMQPTFKTSTGRPYANPVIGMAEVDLNYDKQTEIIALPIESEEEDGLFCNVNNLCPHYVLEVQGKKVAVLGILYGYKVNRGDKVTNGYLTLKAFTDPVNNPDYFKEYSYNPKSNEYELVR